MLRSILQLLRSHPAYALFSLGGLLSSIGSGLTGVVVYGMLSELNASPFSFAFAFAISAIPGLIASYISSRLCYSFAPTTLLIIAELVGAAGVIMPFIGIHRNSILLLQLSVIIPSFLIGFAIPIVSLLIRQTFTDEELAAVTGLDSYTFSANVIIGYGLGTLFFNQLSRDAYLWLDLTTYLLSAGVIFVATMLDPQFGTRPGSRDSISRSPLKWRSLSKLQKRALLLLPALTVIGTPQLALLPAIGLQYGEKILFNGLLLTPALLFLFAKSLGQLLGPFFINPKKIDKALSSTRLFILCSSVFIGLYVVVASVKTILLSLILIVVAHIFSNVIFTVASYSLRRYFNESQVSVASARVYQLQVLIQTVVPLYVGVLANRLQISTVFLICAIPGGVLLLWLMNNLNGSESPASSTGKA